MSWTINGTCMHMGSVQTTVCNNSFSHRLEGLNDQGWKCNEVFCQQIDATCMYYVRFTPSTRKNLADKYCKHEAVHMYLYAIQPNKSEVSVFQSAITQFVFCCTRVSLHSTGNRSVYTESQNNNSDIKPVANWYLYLTHLTRKWITRQLHEGLANFGANTYWPIIERNLILETFQGNICTYYRNTNICVNKLTSASRVWCEASLVSNILRAQGHSPIVDPVSTPQFSVINFQIIACTYLVSLVGVYWRSELSSYFEIFWLNYQLVQITCSATCSSCDPTGHVHFFLGEMYA